MKKQYIKDLVDLSSYGGSRLAFTQAGGGNTSIKDYDSGKMIIKSSGVRLNQVSETSGFTTLRLEELIGILSDDSITGYAKGQQDSVSTHKVLEACETPELKPSMETLVHALFKRVTLHTHSVHVNCLSICSDWQSHLLRLFPDALTIPYRTPGYQLAKEISCRSKGAVPQLTFLQNHGVFISGDTVEDVIKAHTAMSLKIEDAFGFVIRDDDIPSWDSGDYIAIPEFGTALYAVSYLPLVRLIEAYPEFLKVSPCVPDVLVFCGFRPVVMNSESDLDDFRRYLSEFDQSPKLVIMNKKIFVVADSQKKALEAQEVLWFHFKTLSLAPSLVRPLSFEELWYLANWDAETYRQGV